MAAAATLLTKIGWKNKKWGKSSDIVSDPTNGIKIAADSSVNAFGGNDSITGSSTKSQGGRGIENLGSLDTSDGNDILNGTGYEAGIYNQGTILTGKGNDKITGTGLNCDGLWNEGGTINTGDGDDFLIGKNQKSGGCGIYNSGVITTGEGKDKIEGFSLNWSNGIANGQKSSIDLGAGNDAIIGHGKDSAISNYGLIRCGAGDDLINGKDGGFSGTGTWDLGDGNDTVIGFANKYGATGAFKGGQGSDKVLLPQGSYSITKSKDAFIISSKSSPYASMNVYDFESIGSITTGKSQILTTGDFMF